MRKKTILIVDDDPLNLKLLSNKLPSDEYAAITALNGKEAVEKAQSELPDLVLLDIMMPVMDGYQATEILKQDPKTQDIPIILITALDGTDDKLRGLEAGADEFLNKPINTAELLARVKSLLRLKLYQDQLKSRIDSQQALVASQESRAHELPEVNLPKILLVEDEEKDVRLIRNYLQREAFRIEVARTGEEAFSRLLKERIDLILLDIMLPGMDGFEVVRRIKQMEGTENIQIVALTNLQDLESKIKGIELGADDYLVKPINKHELRVRLRSLIRKKAYLDSLKTEYASAVQSAITDRLTGLYNRAYFEHFINLEIKRAERQGYPMALLMMDVDDFKTYNDTLGHLAGDRILKTLGELIRGNIREIDMGARYGGEEFAVILPNTDRQGAMVVAERIRRLVFDHPFFSDAPRVKRKLSVSIGLAVYPDEATTAEHLVYMADCRLYLAKEEGKNRVCHQSKDNRRAVSAGS